jgi:molecular chaperone DnaJ/curved DNA-binding protein
MWAPNYYLILNITSQASASEIEHAYGALCSQYEGGKAGDRQAWEIEEAYQILRDPAGRAEYHRQLARSPASPLRFEPMNLFGSFATYRPSREAIFSAFVHGSTGQGIPKSRRLGDINLEVALSPTEAGRGGMLPLEFPVARLCARCNGTGRTGFFPCDACGGDGMTCEDARVELIVPARTADRAMIPVSLHHLGIDAIGLNAHVRVTDA